jgi:hypothetical protein
MLKEYIIYGIIGAFTGLINFGSIKKEKKERIVLILSLIKNLLIGFLIGICLLGVLNFHRIYSVNYGLFFVFLLGFERLFIRAVGRLFGEEKIKPQKGTSLEVCENVGDSFGFKIFVGIIFITLIFLLFYLPYFLLIEFDSLIIDGLFWGVVGGLAGVAIRGAWKHSKDYGFDVIRFFRSPLIAGIFGMVFSFFTDNYSVIIFTGIGAERMTVDLYKRFFKKSSDEYLMNGKNDLKKREIFSEVFKWFVFVVLLMVGYS